MFDDYWIAIIIITILGFIISMALSFYFIFLPSRRAEEELDTLSIGGSQALRAIEDLINTTSQLGDEIEKDTCESIIYSAFHLFGEGDCLSNSQIDPCSFVPLFCLQYGTPTPCNL